ncbi:hypothetical protein B0H16DRAFT_1792775 [Mycena metata]|uniref:Uncharacterized protein n=1 Tax=Mycena metata TaxID=1033252 RepID=A0AAD7JJB6_9AGAR|nr:hypothetical protein B0H16DRAFT_1792775 [Mycena metata]
MLEHTSSARCICISVAVAVEMPKSRNSARAKRSPVPAHTWDGVVVFFLIYEAVLWTFSTGCPDESILIGVASFMQAGEKALSTAWRCGYSDGTVRYGVVEAEAHEMIIEIEAEAEIGTHQRRTQRTMNIFEIEIKVPPETEQMGGHEDLRWGRNAPFACHAYHQWHHDAVGRRTLGSPVTGKGSSFLLPHRRRLFHLLAGERTTSHLLFTRPR